MKGICYNLVQREGENMVKETTLNYQTVQQSITTQDPVSNAAELHGLLCGLICASQGNNKLPMQYEDSAIMQALFPEIAKQFSHALDQETFTLELLLPDDQQTLPVRMQALAEWTQGFMAGLGEGGFQWKKATKDVQEIMTDLQAIGQINVEEFADDDVATEEDEKAFFEVYEYLRMAVLTIYTDLVIANNLDNNSETLH